MEQRWQINTIKFHNYLETLTLNFQTTDTKHYRLLYLQKRFNKTKEFEKDYKTTSGL